MSLITKKISELTSISSPSSASLLLVQDGDTTYNFGLNNIVLSKNDTNAFVSNDGPAGNVFYLQSTINSTNSTYGGDRAGLIVGPKGIGLWNDTKSQAMWYLNMPVTVEQGGTGATDATTARVNLKVPYSTNDVQMQFSRSTSNGQHFFMSGIAGTNSSYANKRILLFSTDTGFSCYNSTDQTGIWNFKAVGLQDAVKDSMRYIHLQAANQSITAGSGNNITVSLSYTIPTGFELGQILEAWPDYTGTSSGAGMPYVHSCNHWTTISGTAATSYVQFVNLSSSAVKFTAHALVGIRRTSY